MKLSDANKIQYKIQLIFEKNKYVTLICNQTKVFFKLKQYDERKPELKSKVSFSLLSKQLIDYRSENFIAEINRIFRYKSNMVKVAPLITQAQ